MKHKLFFKFLFVYLIVAAASFIIISTFGSFLVNKTLVSIRSRFLYDTAKELASQYENYINFSTFSLYNNLCAISEYEDSTIILTDPSGRIFINTQEEFDDDNIEYIENFNPAKISKSYYQLGNFFDTFDSDMLSVISPLTSNYSIRGYISIHVPMSSIYAQREEILLVIQSNTFTRR